MDAFLDTMFEDAPAKSAAPVVSLDNGRVVADSRVAGDDDLSFIREILSDIAALTGVVFYSMRKLSSTCRNAGRNHLLEGITAVPVHPGSLNAKTKDDLAFICDMLAIPASASVRDRLKNL